MNYAGWLRCCATLTGLWMLGCDGPGSSIVLGPLPARHVHRRVDEDAGSELPDGARPCKTAADCDDGVDCTVDECLPGKYCSNWLDHTRCSDGLICNGVESCDPQRGCVGAPPPTCDDQDPCTVDRCDEEAKDCVHEPRDFDRDGEVDYHCPGGTDCDDFNPNRGMTQPERCGDGVDNDCDDQIDEADCQSVPHDTCADPLDISAGGTFEVPSAGAQRDYAIRCQDSNETQDLVFSFRLDEPHDVKLQGSSLRPDGSDDVASLSLESSCGQSDNELQCGHGVQADLRVRALAAGQYYVVASAIHGATSVLLNAQFTPPTAAPRNQSCATALDVSAGGHFSSDFVGISDALTSSCAVAGQPDLFYKFVLKDVMDVDISAIGNESGSLVVALRQGGCGAASSEVRCQVGTQVISTYHQLPAGEYTLVLEGPSAQAIGFDLDIASTAPTPPTPGDTCSSALPLRAGTSQQISLAGFQNDVNSSCQSQGPDAVLSLTLASAQDLEIKVDGSGSLVMVALQPSCGDPLSELACGRGMPLTTRVHDVPAGRYYLVLDAAMPTDVSVLVNTLPPTPVTAAAANDTCYSAIDIPSTGGVFHGDTSMLAADYDAQCGAGALSPDAAFRLVLAAQKHVVATVKSAFDSVLLRFNEPPTGQPLCSSDNPACNDDGGQNSAPLLDDILPPGTYYYIVDGYGSTNAGEYTLDVVITDP